MPTTQLRRYEVIEGELDEFILWWQTIVQIREQYGFHVVFACVDAERSEFTWIVEHEGDFAAAEQSYLASPERSRAFEGTPQRVVASHVAEVRRLL